MIELLIAPIDTRVERNGAAFSVWNVKSGKLANIFLA